MREVCRRRGREFLLVRQFLWVVWFLVLAWSVDGSTLTRVGMLYYAGSIEGTVTDAAGSPISDATVYVLQNGCSPATTTDANGNFLLSNVEAGPHRVFAYKESDNYPKSHLELLR